LTKNRLSTLASAGSDRRRGTAPSARGGSRGNQGSPRAQVELPPWQRRSRRSRTASSNRRSTISFPASRASQSRRFSASSGPSYVIDARKLGAVPRLVPLRDERYDLEAMLEAIGPSTKLVYVCLPNNPTGTTNTPEELDAYFDRVPPHVLTVLDQAYLEYIDDPDYPDGVEEYLKRGRRVVVLRTFSKIYGLAGLRVGYAAAPASVVTAIGQVRRAFD